MNPIQVSEQVAAIPAANITPRQAMQELTPLEIAAVAGGPEGTVGSGLNPP